MAFYQRASKLVLMPTGAVAAAASTSILLGSTGRRYASQTTNKNMNKLANLNSIKFRSYTSAPPKQQPIPMSNVKKADVAAVRKGSFSSTSGTKQKGFVEWYEVHLQARPVTTKACTGAVLWGIGDIVAQVVPACFDESVDNKEFEYDVPRTARAVTFGFAIHAPLSHLHFNFLEWMAVRGGFQGMSVPVFKTVMEQFVYWSWISNSLYHGCMGAMQGMGFDQIYKRIEDVLWDTQVAQWKFWIPVQLLNFQFVPVKHQLNVVLLTSIVWTALLSAWYPPEKKEVESKTKEESD